MWTLGDDGQSDVWTSSWGFRKGGTAIGADGFGQYSTFPAGQGGRGNSKTVTSFDEETVTDMFSDSVLHSTTGAGEERMGEGMSTDDIGVGGEDKRVNRLGNGAAVLPS